MCLDRGVVQTIARCRHWRAPFGGDAGDIRRERLSRARSPGGPVPDALTEQESGAGHGLVGAAGRFGGAVLSGGISILGRHVVKSRLLIVPGPNVPGQAVSTLAPN